MRRHNRSSPICAFGLPGIPPPSTSSSSTSSSSSSSSAAVSRRDALATLVCAVFPAVLLADRSFDGSKPKKGERGSKEAKGYQLCLSQCLYDCTTPKVGLAKERSQCRVDCKDECAISREQL